MLPPAVHILSVPDGEAGGGEPPPAGGDEKFAELAAALATAKSPLDRLPPAKTAKLTRSADLYLHLKKRISREFHGEAVTNAWLKMFELAQAYKIERLAASPAPLRVFCNAELPGAFVAALNQYLFSRKVNFEWVASSLWKQGQGLGDQYKLFQHQREHWLMGEEASGDLTEADEILKLACRCIERLGARVDLYTADGGIDVGKDFNAQEALNHRLHYGQALCGLLCLRPGGTALLKMYTLHLKESRALVGALSKKFEKVSLHKPSTSRPPNSEVYLVLEGYRGFEDEGEPSKWIDAFRAGDLPPSSAPPPAFTARLLRAQESLNARQIRALKEFVEGRPRSLEDQKAAAALWLNKLQVAQLPGRKKLAPPQPGRPPTDGRGRGRCFRERRAAPPAQRHTP